MPADSPASPPPPPPPPTFDVLPLSNELRQAIADLGYTHPTPVQRAVFEPAARGRDLVVQARTGTGKTAAFGMPLVDVLVKRAATVQALILCPTRELALQVTREVEALAKHRGTRTTAVYGGAPMQRQVDAIKNGAQILVGTPGRVLDHLRRGTLDTTAIRVLILDESDEMLSMGFWPQISEILGFLPETRQTLLFSATLPPDIRRMAATHLKNPEFITLSGDQIGALEILHAVYLSRGDKVSELIQVIEVENPESAIVFCNTKDETKRVALALQQQGFDAAWLNADLAQNDREKVMTATRQGELRFLVATDVAARGIDISHLTHVINYDFPESAESYVHRTGRTGRAGRTGMAIALIEPSDIGNLYLLRLTYKIKPVERQLPSARELKTRAATDLVRLFVEAFSGRKPHADDLELARRLLTHEQADVIIAGLLRDHLGARPDAQEEATAARRARAPRAVPVPVPVPAPIATAAVATPVIAAPSAASAPSPTPTHSPEPGARTAIAAAPVAAPESRPRAAAPRAPESARNPDAAAARTPDPVRARAPGRPSPAESRASHNAEPRRGIRNAVEPGNAQPDGDATEPDPPRMEGVSEVYVSVGRRDGARPSDFQTILEQHGLSPEQAPYIRVRHRHAFVGVRPEHVERVVSLLNGATIAGKAAFAEEARQRV